MSFGTTSAGKEEKNTDGIFGAGSEELPFELARNGWIYAGDRWIGGEERKSWNCERSDGMKGMKSGRERAWL